MVPTSGVRIKGLDELQEKLKGEWAHVPRRKFLQRVGITVQGKARRKAPVDRGLLKGSITYEVDSAEPANKVKIGTNVHYAPSMEGGTGTLADLPGGTGAPHYPPPQKLDGWAIRHGFHPGSDEEAKDDVAVSPGTYGAIVSQIIYRRGGIKPRRFLRDGFDESVDKIEGTLVPRLAKELEEAAASGA